MYSNGTLGEIRGSDRRQGKPVSNSTLYTNLVHYWPLNENSRTRLSVVGTSSFTYYSPTNPLAGPGKSSQAPDFIDDTSTRHLYGGATISGGEKTISVWFNVFSPHIVVPLWVDGTMPNSINLALYNLGTGTDIDLRVRAGDGSSYIEVASTDALADGWHLITGEYDATNKVVRMSIDGVRGAASSALTGNPPSSNGTNRRLGYNSAIGKANGVVMDEIGYWNRLLTDAELLELWNEGNGKFYPF